ncbi:STAS domain-containing protein [Paenibacillus sp. 1P07SE]|uniref:STAS domain-containing protein n=1 Tax=Paenibacillus sp. 1P07SE TaxID=3132209 RepID=UPI0039A61188
MEQLFTVEERMTGDAVILDLRGELNKPAETVLLGSRIWEDGLDQGRSFLILNLQNINYINSGGMAVLIRLARAGKKGKYHTFAYGVSMHYQKLFRMVGLTEYLMIYPDEETVMQRIAALREAERGGDDGSAPESE